MHVGGVNKGVDAASLKFVYPAILAWDIVIHTQRRLADGILSPHKIKDVRSLAASKYHQLTTLLEPTSCTKQVFDRHYESTSAHSQTWKELWESVFAPRKVQVVSELIEVESDAHFISLFPDTKSMHRLYWSVTRLWIRQS
jgi:hypothetical protein